MNKSLQNLKAIGLITRHFFQSTSTLFVAAILVAFAAFVIQQESTSGRLTSAARSAAPQSATQTPTNQRTRRSARPVEGPTPVTPSNQIQEPAKTFCPKISMSCPSSVFAGEEVSCSAKLSDEPKDAVPKYSWVVTSGKITQGQGTPAISVSTAGVREKILTVILNLGGFGRKCGGSVGVQLEQRNNTNVPPPQPETESYCPEISMSCRRSVIAGEVSCSLELSGGTKGAKPQYSWAVTSGTITQGQGTPAISVSTAGVRENTLTVILNLGGFGKKCQGSFGVPLEQQDGTPTYTQTPTPTPTQTPTSTSTQTPTPIHTATPTPTTAIVIISPDKSPSPSPEPSPSAALRLWPWVLAALAAIAALAAAFLLGIPRVFSGLRGGDVLPNIQGSTEVAESQQRLDALILGAKRKQDEEVRCTVFAPYETGLGNGFLVQAFAHLPKQAPLLKEIAVQAERAATERGSKKLGPIERGQELGFYLEMPGLEIDEPQQPVIWMGEITSASFDVTVPETFKPRSINCKLSVSHNNVPIGHIRFNFKISTAPQPAEKDARPEAHADFVRYRLAFISYASADRSEVLKRVQMLDLAKIRYFQDLLSLEPGKQWEPLIYRYIDECDVFYLFWSTAAKKSKWVKKEVQRALKRKGDKLEAPPEIMPVPIEGPPLVPPPPYLASIYFDSKFLYFINPKDNK